MKTATLAFLVALFSPVSILACNNTQIIPLSSCNVYSPFDPSLITSHSQGIADYLYDYSLEFKTVKNELLIVTNDAGIVVSQTPIQQSSYSNQNFEEVTATGGATQIELDVKIYLANHQLDTCP